MRSTNPKIKGPEESAVHHVKSKRLNHFSPSARHHCLHIVLLEISAVQPYVQNALDEPAEIWSGDEQPAIGSDQFSMPAQQRGPVSEMLDQAERADQIEPAAERVRERVPPHELADLEMQRFHPVAQVASYARRQVNAVDFIAHLAQHGEIPAWKTAQLQTASAVGGDIVLQPGPDRISFGRDLERL